MTMKLINQTIKRIFLLKYSILLMIIGIIFFGLVNSAKAASIEIDSWEDLNNMRNDLTADYILMNDLDASSPGYDTYGSATANGGLGWEPIGDYAGGDVAFHFTGTFDGNNYTISDLYINRNRSFVGLFGMIGTDGQVSNVGMINGSFSAGIENNGVGSLAGASFGTINNCYVSGVINLTAFSWAGGLIGISTLGGIVINCYATCDITATGAAMVGGLIGAQGDDTIVSDSYTTGNIYGEFEVGGLIGSKQGGLLSNSYSTMNVTATYYAGGLIGSNDGVTENCYSTGNVVSTSNNSNNYTGGLAATNYVTIRNCYSTSNITSLSNTGGLVGYNVGGSIENSYAMGTVTGANYVGGLVGRSTGTTTSSFWDTQTSGQATSAGGTGKTTIEMQSLSTFNDTLTEGLGSAWDIAELGAYVDEIWFIDNNNDYPKLGWEYIAEEEPTAEPEDADIDSWTAEQYTNPNATCTNRLKLTIKGKHFDKDAIVKIGNSKASSVDRKDNNKLIAKFCLTKLLNIKTDLERSISVTNPDADTKKAKEKINLEDFINNNTNVNTNTNNSEYIKSIQRKLVELGLLDEQYITGIYGPLTTEAVRKFQEQNGIEQTGWVGPVTRGKMGV